MLNILSLELYAVINSYLNYSDIVKLFKLNRYFRDIGKNNNFWRYLTISKFNISIPNDCSDIREFFESLLTYNATFESFEVDDYNYVNGKLIKYSNLNKDYLSLVIDAFRIIMGNKKINAGELSIQFENKEYSFDHDDFDELELFKQQHKIPSNILMSEIHYFDGRLDVIYKGIDQFIEGKINSHTYLSKDNGDLLIKVYDVRAIIPKSRRQYINDLMTIIASMSHRQMIDENTFEQEDVHIGLKQLICTDKPTILTRKWSGKYDINTNLVTFNKIIMYTKQLLGPNSHYTITFDSDDEMWNYNYLT